jgi:excisionase family DNA binding protein
MREGTDTAVTDWIRRIPLDQIPGIVMLLTARLLEEKQVRIVYQQEKLLTAGQLSEQLNVPESWIRSEQRAGRIPARYLGRYVRFKRSEVDAALAEGRR